MSRPASAGADQRQPTCAFGLWSAATPWWWVNGTMTACKIFLSCDHILTNHRLKCYQSRTICYLLFGERFRSSDKCYFSCGRCYQFQIKCYQLRVFLLHPQDLESIPERRPNKYGVSTPAVTGGESPFRHSRCKNRRCGRRGACGTPGAPRRGAESASAPLWTARKCP